MFEEYYEKGYLSPTREKRLQLNPTFVFTESANDEYCVFYSSHPLKCYHLINAYLNFEGFDPENPHQLVEIEKAIMETARLQFSQWWDAYTKMASAMQIVIRVFAGDALEFCQALLVPNLGQAHFQAGTLEPIQILSVPNSPQPITFDVIDTSNLADNLGILNVLVNCVCLMNAAGNSILFTDILLQSGIYVNSLNEFLRKWLCADFRTMLTLLGLNLIGMDRPYSVQNEWCTPLQENQTGLNFRQTRLTWV